MPIICAASYHLLWHTANNESYSQLLKRVNGRSKGKAPTVRELLKPYKLTLMLPEHTYAIERCNIKNEEEIEISETIDGLPVTRIEPYAFSSCSAKSITLPRSVKEIGQGAFANSSVESIDLSYVDSIDEYAFADCRKLYEVKLPRNIETMAMEGRFYGNSLINTPFMEWHTKNSEAVCQNMLLYINKRPFYYQDYSVNEKAEIILCSCERFHPLNSITLHKNIRYISDISFLSAINKIYAHTDDIRVKSINVKKFTPTTYSTLIFDFDGVYAEIPLYAKTLGNSDRMLTDISYADDYEGRTLSELYTNCFILSSDGKFFNTEMYDNSILTIISSWRIKTDIAYKRLKSNYRISENHRQMYDDFLRTHIKKAVRFACDENSHEKIGFYHSRGYISSGKINAMVEYAKRHSSECYELLLKIQQEYKEKNYE